MASRPQDHQRSPQTASVARSPAGSESTQGIDRTSTSDSSFGAFSEVLSGTVGVASKRLPRFSLGDRSNAPAATPSGAIGPETTGAAPRDEPPSPQPVAAHDEQARHPVPPQPVPCEAFEINMDVLREIIAEQRTAAPPDTPTISLPARPSSPTLPYLAGGGEKDLQSALTAGHIDRPASALSITSAKNGVTGSTPRESPTIEAQVEAWSADVANASCPPDAPVDTRSTSPAPPSQEKNLAGTEKPGATRQKGTVEPLHSGFSLSEPSPTMSSNVFPAGDSGELPRLSHSEGEAEEAQVSRFTDSTGELGSAGEGDGGTKRVSLAKRIRGEAKVIAGKLKKDDAKVAEGRALKSGEAI
ncbi:hypothetical protein AURDEDRAFT_172227 [Auricularia subglabra TFB-10046 SS5]|nr:hypothetical protein AURDEDRAFT_172227 [Auricularia subglabra TFB-10046 SS5]